MAPWRVLGIDDAARHEYGMLRDHRGKYERQPEYVVNGYNINVYIVGDITADIMRIERVVDEVVLTEPHGLGLTRGAAGKYGYRGRSAVARGQKVALVVIEFEEYFAFIGI